MVLWSGIRDPGSEKNPFRIPDPEVKKAPDPGSWIRIRNTAINSQSCINQSFSVFYACWWKDPELEPEPCNPKTYGCTEHWAKHFGLLFSPLPRFSSGMKTRAPAMKVGSTRAPRSAHPHARLNKKSIYMYEINYGTKPVMLRIRIRWICMFLGLLDPDPFFQGVPMDPNSDPSIINQKIVRKTLIPTVLWLFLLFIFENWCKCTFKK